MSNYCFQKFGQQIVVDRRGQLLRAELDEQSDWSFQSFLGGEHREEFSSPLGDIGETQGITSPTSDPDLSTDMRVAVPTFYDEVRETVRISATLGVGGHVLEFRLVKPPSVRVHGDMDPRYNLDPEFGSSRHFILRPITIECDVKAPPSREELRAICDEHKHPAAIKRALEAQ